MLMALSGRVHPRRSYVATSMLLINGFDVLANWVGFRCGVYRHGHDFVLIATVKIETRAQQSLRWATVATVVYNTIIH